MGDNGNSYHICINSGQVENVPSRWSGSNRVEYNCSRPYFPSGEAAGDDAATAERGDKLRGGIQHGFARVGAP